VTYYSYDGNGNLTTRTRPAPNQPNPGATVTTNYTYDSLNRVTRQTYSDGVTPEVDSVYDQAVAPMSPSAPLANTNGRLAYAFSPNSTMDIYSYDAMGRTLNVWQCITAPCTTAWNAQQTYDLAGDLTSVAYNTGATLTYQYDGAPQLIEITSSGLSTLTSPLFGPPPSGQQYEYGPVGLLNATLGTSPGALAEARTYNNRTWLNCLQVGTPGLNCTASVYSLYLGTTGVGYAGNGNIISVNDSVNGNWSYSYDGFNRLASAQTPPSNPTLGYSYSYDRFGNRWSQAVTAGTGLQMQLSFNANNQISTTGYRYDAAGNLMMDGVNCYTYDAENRLSSVAPISPPLSGICGADTMSYLYDAEGRRMARVQSGAVVKQYYYDAAGHMITEANASGTWLRAEIYAGSRHLATWNSNTSTTYFNHADWLGTERVRTFGSGTQAGQPCEWITSLPFGDGQSIQPQNGGCTPTPTFFTGKERDSESGLDYFGARYNASSLGRFTSPDPAGGHYGDPQTLNRYAYVANNPLRLTDPAGLDFYLACTQTEENASTCQGGHAGTTTTDANGNSTFTPTVVTSASLLDPESGNTATVNQNGVQITTDQGAFGGEFISNTPAANGIQGSGALAGFTFDVNGNCSGTCLASGAFHFNGSGDEARALLTSRGAWSYWLLDRLDSTEFGFHNETDQFRFGSGPSPHLSVPWNDVMRPDYSKHMSGINVVDGYSHFVLEWVHNPKATVPINGDFHVDKATGLTHARDAFCSVAGCS
jgi:RHS repeat-associated protein